MATATHGHHHKAKTTHLQVLSINDFHGNLEPPSGSSGTLPGVATPVGGAAYLSTWMTRLREAQKHTVTVGAGDLIGASPLISGALPRRAHDRGARTRMGLEVSSVGNHEFDEGVDELLRMQNGGCHPVDGCRDGDPFTGAAFQYLAANVATRTRPASDPAALRDRTRPARASASASSALTLEGTPLIVTPSGVAGLQFDDEIETVNKYAEQLKKRA